MKTRLSQILTAILLAGAINNKAFAVDFHVATAQDLQNALTLAANNGADNTIWLSSGYYIGNFNFNSTGGYNLTIQNEPAVTNNTQIALDGAGTGRDMNLANSSSGNFTVRGITFLRNCGNKGVGALRIAGGATSTILIQNCQFLSPTNTSGMGLEVVSGLDATVSNCTAIGSTTGGGGKGLSISVTGNVSVQSCVSSTNRASGNYSEACGGGLYVGSATFVAITNSVFGGNSADHGGGVYCGGSATLTGSAFTGNWAKLGGGAYYDGNATLTENAFTGNSVSNGNDNTAGGGAYCNGSATLSGNIFTGNSARSGFYTGVGGGAYCNGSATLSGNTFAGNSATSGGNDSSYGGGVYCNGNTTLTGNTFTGNSVTSEGNGSSYGGGVYCVKGATMSRNAFSANSARDPYGYRPAYGGGAYCSSGATTSGNSFTGNSATGGSGFGGGLYTTGGTPAISGNSFQQNSASTSGGGLYASAGTITISDNLLVKNNSGVAGQGAGIWVNASTALSLINNTLTANSATDSGGGVAFQVDSTVELLNVYNNIIWGNSAAVNGADVWLAGTGQQKIFRYNDVHNMYGVWDIAQNLLDLDPQFFDPVNGDYHLRPTSPCANVGTIDAPAFPLADLDGNARTNSAGQVDLGCYEFCTTATHPADTNADFILTSDEFNGYAAAWKAGQAWSNAPVVIPADYVTRAGYLMTNGGTYRNDGSARPVNWKPAR